MSTEIAWTDETWNPTVGCTRVSAGCENCYAETFAHRGLRPEHQGLTVMGPKGPRWTGEVRLLPERLDQPLRWRKPRRIFVDSMSDLFHENVPFEFIDRVFAVMALCPQHTFQVLTKRPERMRDWADKRERYPGALWDAHIKAGGFAPKVGDLPEWPLPNVHLGISAENQETLDERMPHLLATPAAVRFLSLEPLLEGICLSDAFACEHGCPCNPEPKIHWVIVGGESGPGARPCDIEWIRSIVKQCREAGVACFTKQLGSYPVCFKADLSDWPRHVRFTGDGVGSGRGRILFKSRKGSDPSDWPADLRVREMPAARRSGG